MFSRDLLKHIFSMRSSQNMYFVNERMYIIKILGISVLYIQKIDWFCILREYFQSICQQYFLNIAVLFQCNIAILYRKYWLGKRKNNQCELQKIEKSLKYSFVKFSQSCFSFEIFLRCLKKIIQHIVFQKSCNIETHYFKNVFKCFVKPNGLLF